MALVLRLWWRFWPGWLFLLMAALMPLGTLAGSLLGLDFVRDQAAVWATLCMLLLGIPLLLAWAAWSLLRVRHWAGRLAIFGAFVVGGAGGVLWFIVAHPPQM